LCKTAVIFAPKPYGAALRDIITPLRETLLPAQQYYADMGDLQRCNIKIIFEKCIDFFEGR
jgi:hypothetical protein